MGWWGGVGGFLVITVSHPTFCCVGVGLWLRWGWAVTKMSSFCCHHLGTLLKKFFSKQQTEMEKGQIKNLYILILFFSK